jgi:hypothetical protein
MKLHHSTAVVLVAIGLAVAGVAYANSSKPKHPLKTASGFHGPKLSGGVYLVEVEANLEGPGGSCTVVAATPHHAVSSFSNPTSEIQTPPQVQAATPGTFSFSGVLDIPARVHVGTDFQCAAAAADVRWWVVRLNG